MKKTLSTRDALLVLRKVVSEDGEKAAKITELTQQLNDAVAERATAIESALGTLEGYVSLHTQMHGFSDELEELVATTSRPTSRKVTKKTAKKKATRKKTSKKKVAKKKVAKKKTRGRTGRNGGPQVATGYPGELAASINLSEVEQRFVDLLSERWPTFVTPQTVARKKIIPQASHVTAKVNQLRRKGIPIESARQARQRDESISDKTRGYRLIG